MTRPLAWRTWALLGRRNRSGGATTRQEAGWKNELAGHSVRIQEREAPQSKSSSRLAGFPVVCWNVGCQITICTSPFSTCSWTRTLFPPVPINFDPESCRQAHAGAFGKEIYSLAIKRGRWSSRGLCFWPQAQRLRRVVGSFDSILATIQLPGIAPEQDGPMVRALAALGGDPIATSACRPYPGTLPTGWLR